MGATSVTGVGRGMSNGQYKPENSTGCCGNSIPTESVITPIKTGCVTRIKVGNSTKYTITSGNASVKVC